MLVLSRKTDETVVFPQLGVTIRVVRLRGNAVQLGITAPPHLTVLRGELAPAVITDPLRAASHELSNRLSRVGLRLQLFRRQQQAGRFDEAEATLDGLFAELAELDKDWIDQQLRREPVPAHARALVVDDDANERELLASLLRLHGLECATVSNGEEALAHLSREERPAVVLLDMVMPRCDGPNTVRQIRREPHLRDLPVYAISGLSPSEAGIEVGPQGLDGWFAKPLNVGKLWEVLARTLAHPN